MMLYEAPTSPGEEVTDVPPNRAQQLSFCFRGPNYLRSFPWPLDRGRKGYPHLISFTHQTSGEAGKEYPACVGPEQNMAHSF